MDNQDTTNATSEDQGTSNLETENTSQVVDENVSTQTTQQSSDQVSDVDQNDSQNQTQRNFQAEEGKMSKLEKELHYVKKQLQEKQKFEEALNEVQETFRNDKDSYERFREAFKKVRGKDMVDYDTFTGRTLTGQGTAQPQQSVQQQPTQFDIDAIVESKVQATLYNRNLETSLRSFIDKLPDYTLNGIEEGSFEHQQRLDKIARLVRYGGQVKLDYPEMSEYDTFQEAYEMLNRKQVQQKAAQVATIAGAKNAYAASTGIGNVSSQQSGTTAEDLSDLTELQRDRYSEYLKSDPKHAKYYLEAVRQHR